MSRLPVNDRASGSPAPASGPSTDVLSDVLRAVRLSGAVFFDVHATAPWVAESPASARVAQDLMPGAGHVIPFHVLTRGTCHAATLDGQPRAMRAGDVIVFPRGDAHVMSSAPGGRSTPDLGVFRRASHARLPVRIQMGGAGRAGAHLICGFFACDAKPFNPLLESLPRVVIVRGANAGERRWLDTFVESALAESTAPTPGGETVLARLSELLFIEVVRRHVRDLPAAQSGWLAGLRDPAISKALALLHREPHLPWSLEELAAKAGLSRSVLAERFNQLIGLPPMQYLARWRMQVAARLLTPGGPKVAAVAEQVGYDSEAAFSRAFKKFVGSAPAAWRRAREAAPRS